jgi:hypothetical protein
MELIDAMDLGNQRLGNRGTQPDALVLAGLRTSVRKWHNRNGVTANHP